MSQRQRIQIAQKQRLALNASLQASIRLLRSDTAGLTRYLEDQAAENPHLRLIGPGAPALGEWLPRWTGILTRAAALRLLRAGFRRGLISEQQRDGWPQNVWAVTDDGDPVEAMLENSAQGTYQGYPMPKDDPFRVEILQRWEEKP